eukprot:6203618-Pleurochrysis_carterae.AAC.1
MGYSLLIWLMGRRVSYTPSRVRDSLAKLVATRTRDADGDNFFCDPDELHPRECNSDLFLAKAKGVLEKRENEAEALACVGGRLFRAKLNACEESPLKVRERCVSRIAEK